MNMETNHLCVEVKSPITARQLADIMPAWRRVFLDLKNQAVAAMFLQLRHTIQHPLIYR
jgi:hypothetical protein